MLHGYRARGLDVLVMGWRLQPSAPALHDPQVIEVPGSVSERGYWSPGGEPTRPHLNRGVLVETAEGYVVVVDDLGEGDRELVEQAVIHAAELHHHQHEGEPR